MNRRLASVLLVMAVVGGPAVTALASSASAEPGVTTTFPAGASTLYFTGEAFDTCTAPSLTQMATWRAASPYRGVGVYVGGPNRGCAQPHLTASWVTAVTQKGWKLMPVYVGLQAPCSTFTRTVVASRAADQGKASATDAISALKALGMLPGSIVYADMEGYSTTNGSCRDAVLTYLSAYTEELHRRGYLAGVYGKATSAVKDLSAAYASSAYARPDAIWMADWGGEKSLRGMQGVAETSWTVHQRAKQYQADHYQTFGGVKLRIDSNLVDVPVANVARVVKATAKAKVWPAPTTSGTSSGTVAKGATVKLVCQAPGPTVSGTRVWDKLTNGTYVSDAYLSTASKTRYSKGVPRCRYAYQVTAANGTTMRQGAGASSPAIS